MWRFLWREPPERIDAGQLRQLVVTVTPPASPGLYEGELEILDGAVVRARLPVSLRVGDFALATPLTKRVGTYLNVSRFSDRWLEVMLRDIRAHGGTKVKWWAQLGLDEVDGRLLPDDTLVRQYLLLQHRLGFEPPYTVGTSAEAIARRLGLPGGRHAPDPDSLRASQAYREKITGRPACHSLGIQLDTIAHAYLRLVQCWFHSQENEGYGTRDVCQSKGTGIVRYLRTLCTYQHRHQPRCYR